jgi:hypothetical protein
MNIIEVFMSGYNQPSLYDVYIDKAGTIWTMDPPPPGNDCDVIQAVLENHLFALTPDQESAIMFLMKVNDAEAHLYFEEYRMAGYMEGVERRC